MNRAGPDHDKDAMILSIKDILDHAAALRQSVVDRVGGAQGRLQVLRCHQYVLGGDIDIVYFDVAHRYLPDKVIPVFAGLQRSSLAGPYVYSGRGSL